MPATTVPEYLAGLPADRRAALEAVRRVILDNLDAGYEEGMQYGMVGYYVPHRLYPAGYHANPSQPLPFVSLASQKGHMALYLMCLYGSPEHEQRFKQRWKASGKKLDMGKSCVRFKKLEDLPLEVIAETIREIPAKQLIASYESALAGYRASKKPRKTPKPAKKRR